jgi:hypothetical protein
MNHTAEGGTKFSKDMRMGMCLNKYSINYHIKIKNIWNTIKYWNKSINANAHLLNTGTAPVRFQNDGLFRFKIGSSIVS